MIEKIAVGTALVLGFAADAWYCSQIMLGTISPALATWLIFAVAATVSLVSYLTDNEKEKPFIANVANRFVVMVVWVVVLFVAFSPKSDIHLHNFDIGCFVVVAFILVMWAMTHSAVMANLFIQLVMVAGYAPTLFRIFHQHRNTETFVTWGMNFAVAVLFLVPSIRHRDRLAMVYAGRATVCVATILAVMAYFQFIGPR